MNSKADDTEGVPKPPVPPPTPTRKNVQNVRLLSSASGHNLSTISGAWSEAAPCPGCGLRPPRIIAHCTECHLCPPCCLRDTVARCPALGNGGPLHQHPLTHTPVRYSVCLVGGWECGSLGQGWRCEACNVEVCAACIARPPPEGFRRAEPLEPLPLAGTFVPVCPRGHTMGRDVRSRNTCDSCQTTGTHWRCTAGCDYDNCEACYTRTAQQGEDAEDFAAIAEEQAAQQWEQQGEAEVAAAAAVIGTGSIQEEVPARRGAAGKGRGRAATAGRGRGRGDPKGKGKGQRMVKGVCPPLMPPPLQRHLSARSRVALTEFSMGAERGSYGVADVSTAEELLSRAVKLGISEEAREQVREAVARRQLHLAGQLMLAATCGTQDVRQCSFCLDKMGGEHSMGGSVACLNGHLFHAGCAADLALYGHACPTCREPLFFSTAGVTSKDITQHKTEVQGKAHRFTVGDRVLLSSDVRLAQQLQEVHPLIGGWHEDMASCCGREGIVRHVFREVETTDGVVCPVVVEPQLFQFSHQEVTESALGLASWRWHPGLVTLMASAETTTTATASQSDLLGRRQVDRLRDELAVVRKRREDVRQAMLRALGIEDPTVEVPGDGSPLPPPPPAAGLQRAESVTTASSVGQLKSLGGTFVDLQRARRLLALAKAWGEDAAAVRAREAVHEHLRAARVEQAAQHVRHYNVRARFEELLWAQAVASTTLYKVAPGVRLELLTAPKLGALRTGFTLSPGEEFNVTKEVLDKDGRLWVRVGSSTDATEALKRKWVQEHFTDAKQPKQKHRGPVLLEHLPGSVGARVCRGPDWRWDNQDGGPGSLGTLVGTAGGNWVTVRWDIGAQNNYRCGHEDSYDLVYAGPPPFSSSVVPQGWVDLRPSGPGAPMIATPACGVACFDCGGPLVPAFSRTICKSTDEQARMPFVPAEANKVKPGSRLLVAATLVEVVVESVVPISQELGDGNGEATGQGSSEHQERGQERGGQLQVGDRVRVKPGVATPRHNWGSVAHGHVGVVVSLDAAADDCRVNFPTQSHWHGVLSEMELAEDQAADDGGQPAVVALVCRPAAADPEDAETFIYMPEHLVWPSAPAEGEQSSPEEEQFCLYQGARRSRRELVLLLGSAAAARELWNKGRNGGGGGGGGGGAFDPVAFASCVRGHLLHARCFQGRLVAGKGCPVEGCGEPLFVPQVQRETRDDGSACCGADTGTQQVAEALDLARDAERFAQGAVDTRTISDVAAAGSRTLRMCPVCFAGPLLNENCADMNAHHGQCPRCSQRPFTSAQIAERVASGSGAVGDRIPVCASCNMKVMFNGCVSCGHLFAGINWDTMPVWEPNAKTELDTSERYLRSVRLLAQEVRNQASHLAHEEAALRDHVAVGASPDGPRLDLAEAPPPPRFKFNSAAARS